MIQYYCNIRYESGEMMDLKECKLFKDTKIDIDKILVKEFPSNYIIEIEGDSSTYLGIVLEGQVNITSYSLAGKVFTINRIQPGSIYGDILVYGSITNSYPGNLVTSGKTKIAMIPNNQLKKLLINEPNFLRNFLESLSDKVYQVNSTNKMLSQESLRDKILFFLHQQKRIQHSNQIELKMTKEDLANLLYIPRPSLSRELANMKKDGIIDYDRYTITIK